MATTQTELNAITENIKTEVAEVKKVFTEGHQKTQSEIKEVSDKFGKELAAIQGRQEKLEHVIDTIIDTNPGDGIKRQTTLDPNAGAKHSKVYSLMGYEPHPVKRMLYKPRTSFDRKAWAWKLKGGYDGLEELMDLNDQLYLYGVALAKKNQDYREVIKQNDLFKFYCDELKAHPMFRKALSTGDDSMADLVPTQMSASLIDDVRLMLKVAALFRTINLPRSSYEAPIRGSRMRAYLVAEPTSDDSTKIPGNDPNATKMAFSAVTFGVRVLFSDDLDIDSVIPILPFVTEEVRQALVDGAEDSIVNGDTTSTHQDSDVTAANDLRKAYPGLRKLSGGTSGTAAVDISTYNIDNLRAIRKAMGRFAVNPMDLAWIMSISAYIQALSIDQVETVEKYGPNATILTGELGRIDNIPIVVSEFVRQDMNTSGVYDGATTTDTITLLVNRMAYMVGSLRNQRTEVDRNIETQQTIVVATEKRDFRRTLTPGSGEQSVGIGYSLTS